MTQSTDDSNWKQAHADACDAVFETALVQQVMEEYALNMGFEKKGLAWYGLTKVAMYAAQVARAQALGFDPELLRASPEEATAAQLQHARYLVERGVPTIVVDASTLGIVDVEEDKP